MHIFKDTNIFRKTVSIFANTCILVFNQKKCLKKLLLLPAAHLISLIEKNFRFKLSLFDFDHSRIVFAEDIVMLVAMVCNKNIEAEKAPKLKKYS